MGGEHEVLVGCSGDMASDGMLSGYPCGVPGGGTGTCGLGDEKPEGLEVL